jgi:RHS repeat-associated protein
MGTVRYTVVNGRVLGENRDGVKRDYLSDSLGSTMALVDNTQTKTDVFTYWPYGEERTRTGATATPFRFVGTRGYYRDTANRVYVRARGIRPDICRWQAQDPLLFVGEKPNLYSYAFNNPTTYIDASGYDVGWPGRGRDPWNPPPPPGIRFIGCTYSQQVLVRHQLYDICMRRLHLVSSGSGLRHCLGAHCSDLLVICRTAANPNCTAGDCGFGKGRRSPPHNTINLCPDAFNPAICGCLGKTIAHEMVHGCLQNEGESPSWQCEWDLYGPGRPPCRPMPFIHLL